MTYSSLWNVLLSILSGIVVPVLLLGCGIILSCKIRILRIIRPKSFFEKLTDIPKDSRMTPLKAVSTALAGTLGVGNITGVSAAILQGGAGSIFWMWVGAFLSMAVKYGEVALAVQYRKRTQNGTFTGGAMYTIRDGLAQYIGYGRSLCFGNLFAVLCIINALVTGTIVQANAAADVCTSVPEWVCGLFLALLTLLAAFYGIRRVGDITVKLIPVLTVLYVVLSFRVILSNFTLLPGILMRIVREAFTLSAVQGGITGFTIREAIRFGITRGIFSNEAGCGTSPTAHASADTKSPHHQGLYGIFEVFCDTILLCTLTAFVILTADTRYGILTSGSALTTLEAFALFGGTAVYRILGFSVVLFAYSSILAQLYYGISALQYFSASYRLRRLYIFITACCAVLGAVISPGIMWGMADLIISVMTCLNVGVLLILRKEITEISQNYS